MGKDEMAQSSHVTQLFSPRELNLRNLLWHGFMVPSEVDTRHAALLLLLVMHTSSSIASLGRATDALQQSPRHLWMPCGADAIFVEAQWLLIDERAKSYFPLPPSDGCCAVCLASPFCRPGFASTLRRALASYRRGAHARFAVLALPMLEAGLRWLFVRANPSDATLGDAHVGEYFSTLDGYGQRAKHQLLLDFRLHSTGELNQLVVALGRGLHVSLQGLEPVSHVRSCC